LRLALGPVIALLLAYPAAPSEIDPLAALSRRYLEGGGAAAQQALVQFAQQRPGSEAAALARFVLGWGAYQGQRFAVAAEQFALALEPTSELADYTVHYRALAQAELGEHSSAASLLADFARRFPASPLAAAAEGTRLESLSLSGRAREALELLAAARPATAAGWLRLGRIAERAGELAQAAQGYQRVYYEYPTIAEASAARAALNSLKTRLGARYPSPSAAWRLGRADRLAAAERYREARTEYAALSLRLKGLPREQAAVRVSVCDYHLKAYTRAYQALKKLSPVESEASAERLYYLAACARHLRRSEEFLNLVAQLGRQHPASSWHEEALFAAGNSFLVENEPERYVSFYRAVFENSPQGRHAARAHWKVAWRAYMNSGPEAARLFDDHLRLYPGDPQTAAALYWLGRLAEAGRDPARARTYYSHLAARFPHYYHAQMAKDRLGKLPAAAGDAATPAGRLPAALPAALPATQAPPAPPPSEWIRWLDRARLLDKLGLDDLAERELRFRAQTPALAYPAALELAQHAARRGDHHLAMRLLKRYTPGYMAFPINSLPRRYWELLFPWPWREEIESYSRLRDLDPYLVAALIRQESEFNPGAISRAKARGLMQIMLPTGRLLGRQLGLRTLSPRQLYVPETSLRLGTLHFRRVLDQYQGRLEPALAGYNAGEHRADRWLSWDSSYDPAEFVENIPFTETRDYVQAVLRNAEIYRKLYGQ